MPPHASTNTDFEIDRTTNTIRFVRSFSAPASLLFEAWTRPEQLRCWWDASGGELTVCEIDLRPGGKFRFVSQSYPNRPFGGVYLEIAPPDRLVFEAMNSTGRVTFTSAEGRTRMTLEIVCGSAEQQDEFIKMGVAAGTAQTINNLRAFIQRQGVTA